MKLRKKILTTTLAASLMLGSISGLPLSTQGALNKLGMGTAVVQAAETNPLQYLDKFLDELDKDIAGRNAIIQVNNRIIADFEDDIHPDDYFAEFVKPVLDKIELKLIAESKTADLDDYGRSIFRIIAHLAYPIAEYNIGNGTLEFNLWDIMVEKGSDLRQFVNEIALLGGVPANNKGKAQFDESDLIAYVKAYETALSNKLDPLTVIAAVLDHANNTSDLADAVVDAMLSLVTEAFDDVSGTKLGGVLAAIGITGEDLLKSLKNIVQNYDSDKKGLIALGAAVVRTQLDFTTTVSDNGRTVKPVLKFKSASLQESVVWSAAGGAGKITYDSSAKAFKLDSSVTSDTATIHAMFGGILAYQGELEMKYTGGFIGGGGGGGGMPAVPEYKAPDNVGTIISDASAAIGNASKQLQSASQDDRDAIIRELRAQIAEAIAGLAHVDVTSAVVIDGNSGKATVDAAKLDKELKKITEEIAKLNAELKALDPTSAPVKAELTLDFGTVAADNLELTIPKAVMETAKANGLSHVSLQVNGAAIAFAVADYQADVKFNINKQDDKTATAATNLPLASGVYDLNISVDGKPMTSFESPIEVRLPVTSDALDEELLSVVKVVDGMIIIYGGNYNPNSNTVDVSLKGFSVYTVVENKVEFKDIASVQSWAGRPIQVAAAKGIINGRGDGVFDPQESVTRAEFAKMIVIAFGLEDAGATHSFSDVKSSDWFNSYVAAAVKAGIVKGRSATTFEPNGTITRAEMATMAARALVITGKAKYIMNVNEALSVFTDKDQIHSSMIDSVALAAKLGIVIGENSQFNPNNASTRAQAAVVIYRLLNQ